MTKKRIHMHQPSGNKYTPNVRRIYIYKQLEQGSMKEDYTDI